MMPTQQSLGHNMCDDNKKEAEEAIATASHPIHDAGQTLRGARKHTQHASSQENAQDQRSTRTTTRVVTLDTLWPKPQSWIELSEQIGPVRAALAMVIREGLAKQPHRDGWLNTSAQLWTDAYAYTLPILREIIEARAEVNLASMIDRFNQKSAEFAPCAGATPRLQNHWSYAIGLCTGKKIKHPFNLTPVDDLRWRYLHEWGWPTNPRVSDRLSMGALAVKDRTTGQTSWRAVEGKSGMWVYLTPEHFSTEREAIEHTREHVQQRLLKTHREVDTGTSSSQKTAKPMNWDRPAAPTHQRTGFDRPNATGMTELDLIREFGFRGVEFGNWVTQKERREFVDAIYDALVDMTELLGMPARFASLDGLLGLAYGSRGKGLKSTAAHFEVGNWVLHLTKDHGPGSLAHEFGHAIDAWAAHAMWGDKNAQLMASEQTHRYACGADVQNMPLAREYSRWATQIDPWLNSNDKLALRELGRPPWKWIQIACAMDRRTKPYWSSRSEIFARAFELLVSESLQARGRTCSMLVSGIDQESGLQAQQNGSMFPYPMGHERVSVCKQVAVLVRAIKTHYATHSYRQHHRETPQTKHAVMPDQPLPPH